MPPGVVAAASVAVRMSFVGNMKLATTATMAAEKVPIR